jgi:hypothetical protein
LGLGHAQRTEFGYGVVAFALVTLLELAVSSGLEPPEVLPVSAPAPEFSAARAALVHGRLLAERVPHPVGSSAQALVRERLLGELRTIGLEPELESGVACSHEGTCAELHDVLARVPGSGTKSDVALVAHYDSAGAGPGAGDDGQGVAALVEIARALTAAPAGRGVRLIFTDGEELGLLGARLFAREHRSAAELRVVLNLEARGSRGPSLMFQTTPGSGWLVQRFGSAPRPVASSLFGAVYRALPNDTDLTVFSEHGVQGLNFAFVDGVENYHTSRDVPELLDFRSVQQEGDAALATVRALGEHGIQPPSKDAVYFDVLGLRLVTLPLGAMLPAALAALFALGFALRRDLLRPDVEPTDLEPSDGAAQNAAFGSSSLRRLGRAGLALGIAWGLPVLAAALLGLILTLLGALPFPIIAHPLPAIVGELALVLGAQGLALSLARSDAERRAFAGVTWFGWAVLGVALAAVVPEASYVVVLPASLAAALRLGLRLAGGRRPGGHAETLGALGVALFTALLWLPLLTLVPSVLGLSSPAVLAAATAVGLSPFAPLWGPLLARGRRPFELCSGGAVLLASLLARSPYSAQVPQRLSLVLEREVGGAAYWLADANAGPLPPALRRAADFAPQPSHPHPWPAYRQTLMYAAPAPSSENLRREPPPELRLVRHGGSSLELSLDAPANLWGLGVRLPSGQLREARWRGQRIEPEADGSHERFLIVPGAERSLSVELDFEGPVPAELDVLALERGLPDAGRALLEARGAEAVASAYGDLTLTHLPARVRE